MELKAWLIILAVALLLTGIGLLLLLLSGAGSLSDFFAGLAGINIWLLAGILLIMAGGVVLLIKTADRQASSKWSIIG